MKKIISVVLAMSCLLALCACSNIPIIGGFFGGVSSFEKAIKNTDPSKAYIETSAETTFGTLTSNYEIVYSEDGSAVIKYSYDKVNPIGSEATEEISKITGTITRAADGTYSGDMEAIDVSSVSAGIALDLSAISTDAVTINDAGDVLTAVVAAADTEAVFGKAYSKDINLEITIKDKSVTYILMTYEGGRIVCRYE